MWVLTCLCVTSRITWYVIYVSLHLSRRATPPSSYQSSMCVLTRPYMICYLNVLRHMWWAWSCISEKHLYNTLFVSDSMRVLTRSYMICSFDVLMSHVINVTLDLSTTASRYRAHTWLYVGHDSFLCDVTYYVIRDLRSSYVTWLVREWRDVLRDMWLTWSCIYQEQQSTPGAKSADNLRAP